MTPLALITAIAASLPEGPWTPRDDGTVGWARLVREDGFALRFRNGWTAQGRMEIRGEDLRSGGFRCRHAITVASTITPERLGREIVRRYLTHVLTDWGLYAERARDEERKLALKQDAAARLAALPGASRHDRNAYLSFIHLGAATFEVAAHYDGISLTVHGLTLERAEALARTLIHELPELSDLRTA